MSTPSLNGVETQSSKCRGLVLLHPNSRPECLSAPQQAFEIDHIAYGFHATPFGQCLIGVAVNTGAPTVWAVCFLAFIEADKHAASLASLARMWPGAALKQAQSKTATLAHLAFAPQTPGRRSPKTEIYLLVQGTAFQRRVWRALLGIPFGSTSSYSAIAHRIGASRSFRAVGSAVAANPIAWLIPCHRVVRADGKLGGYRWGERRKAACLEWETRFACRSSI